MENKELEEKISLHFKVPYVYSPELKIYACKNGVWFKQKEFEEHENDEAWLQEEFNRRSNQASYPLCDYDLVRKEGTLKTREPEEEIIEDYNELEIEREVISEPVTDKVLQKPVAEKKSKSIMFISAALGLVSIVSMYISTVHTATYLFDYVDMVSAWLMSAVITIYSSTAFEVVILFHERRKHILSVIFAFLWALVITFSMITTVSVFYDRFNFETLQDAEANQEEDGSRLALEILQKEEASLREAIDFKKEDIEYRRSMDYATNERTHELNDLQASLQENLNKQKEILQEMPNASKKAEEVHRKESLFAFLGRIMNIEGGILEFIMSTLSAIFVNLISPLSLTVVVSFTEGGRKDENNNNNSRA